MRFKLATVLTLTAVMASPLFAEESAGEADEAQEDPKLEAEIAYVEALIYGGFADFAGPVIEATKKQWPGSEARFFAIEIRSLISQNQMSAAEAKLAGVDKSSLKYWAARLEIANGYYSRGRKDEGLKIYEEFFQRYQKPPKELYKFYVDARFTYSHFLADDKLYDKAVKSYEELLKHVKDEDWCSLACEACDLYIKLIDKSKTQDERKSYAKSATKLCDDLLWHLDLPVYFGRAVSMKAHIEELCGNVTRASELIDEYRPQLTELHAQIVDFDPDGLQGLLRQSPLPECLYVQAKIRFNEAKAEFKKPKRDDEKIKSLMFGPLDKAKKKRLSAKGAYAIARDVFLNYEMSSWAPDAKDLADEIAAFAEGNYNAKIKNAKLTPEQEKRIREAQFRAANENFTAGREKDAIAGYYAALARYPEAPESIPAIENIASALVDSTMEKPAAEREELDERYEADAIEGYLAERFSDAKDQLMLIAAGDAVLRLAAKESQYQNPLRAEWLYQTFCRNYKRHPMAANAAANHGNELYRKGYFEESLKFWQIIAAEYTNSMHYASSLLLASECYRQLGEDDASLDWLERYVGVEKQRLPRLQARVRLASTYRERGYKMLKEVVQSAGDTNVTAEAVGQLEKTGTAQILRAIRSFQAVTNDAAVAEKDLSVPSGERAKIRTTREQALFLIGDCWGRLSRPTNNVAVYRRRAIESYEQYLNEFPPSTEPGKGSLYATNCYVRISTIYTALGEMEKAKDALDQLSKKFPDSQEAKDAKPRLARSLIDMGLKDKGAEIYRDMIHTQGANYTARQYLEAGEALVEAGAWDLANEAYERAIQMGGASSVFILSHARYGIAQTAWKQGDLTGARDAIDRFLENETLAKLAMANEVYDLLIDVASAQCQKENDQQKRTIYYNEAVKAIKKLRNLAAAARDRATDAQLKAEYQAKMDELDLRSGAMTVRLMEAEERIGLADKALATCAKAASTYLAYVQTHRPEVLGKSLEDMGAEVRGRLQTAYERMLPLYGRLGPERAKDLIEYAEEYLRYFPTSHNRSDVETLADKARAELKAAGK